MTDTDRNILKVEAILEILYPRGVPVAHISKMDQVKDSINKLIALTRIYNDRIIDPVLSNRITEDIKRMRDDERLTWSRIAKNLGNGITPEAARSRYRLSQKQELATVEELNKISFNNTNGPLFQHPIPNEARPEEPPAQEEAQPKEGPKIPHENDEFIFNMRESGAGFPAIKEHLIVLGIDCTDADVSSRYHLILKKKGLKRPDGRHKPRLSDADMKLLELHKENKDLNWVAAEMGRTVGGPWTGDMVRSRLKALRVEGEA